MDKYFDRNYIEKDREEELFCRLQQIRAQLQVVLASFEDEETSFKEIYNRLGIIKHLLAWYVIDENGKSWNQRLEELPRLLSNNEKVELMSAFVISEKYVRKLQAIIDVWKDTYTLANVTKLEVDCVKLKVEFILDLLGEFVEKKQFPMMLNEALEPKAWYLE
jgi:hypothetical protein